MTINNCMKLLVGDNPFHGISHLTQERSRKRNEQIRQVEFAAGLVTTAIENGADGFMFSVSDTTLAILKEIREKDKYRDMELYAIVPYAYEYVRLATKVGGIPGLAKQMTKHFLRSMDLGVIGMGMRALVDMNPKTLMKAYVLYEISRIKSAFGKDLNLSSVILHEIITEMALAFDLDWFFKDYIVFLRKRGIKPGFETRNFALLVNKFREWNIDFGEVCITSAFNKLGFQMNPSKEVCIEALQEVKGASVIAMSILASGYLSPSKAIDYIKTLPNLSGTVVGVSKERHSKETFHLLKSRFENDC